MRKNNAIILSLSSAAVIAALGYFDYRTGIEVPLSIFYLVPIGIVSWYMRRWAGYSVSILSVIAYCLSHYIGQENMAQPAVLFINCGARLIFFLMSSFMLSRLKFMLVKEVEFARTDPLTRIANRRFFYERAELAVNQAKRNGRPLSLAYLDLDDFKPLNDIWGHSHGDLILTIIANEICDNIRKTDLVARLGGDEFGILLPEADKTAAINVIRKLQVRLLDLMTAKGYPITFSFGVATFDNVPDSVDILINKADRLMYLAKGAGKNSVLSENY
jgi:diguanylate cyclase (GGDEF)-like protein